MRSLRLLTWPWDKEDAQVAAARYQVHPKQLKKFAEAGFIKAWERYPRIRIRGQMKSGKTHANRAQRFGECNCL